MKKYLSLFLALVLTILAASCSQNPPSSSGSTVSSVDDLAGKIIGVQQGTTGDIYCSMFAEENEGTTIERFKNGAEAVTALLQGKVDAVVIDDQPAKVFVEKNDGKIHILDEEFENEDYAICIAKENTALLEEINSAIQEIKADGTLAAITDYYINKTEGSAPYESPANVDRSKGKLIMATNAAFEPYEYWQDGKIVGFDADLAQAICDRLGYELQIDDMEFDSIIVAVSTGKADFGAAGMTINEDRLQNINFTDTYCNAVQAVIVRK